VDLSPEQQAQIVDEVGLTAVQGRLSSGSNGKIRSQNPVRRLVPMPVTLLLEDESRLQGLTAEFIRMSESRKPPTGFDTFLLDSSTPQQPGGTGKVFDWNRIAPLVHVMNKSVKVIAAGGLTPENVGEAMRILRPWGVDVSSGVEVIPGKKDPVKVRAFIQAVRNMDKN
jgi:phosphoribosylanthranilate isomerase